MRCNVCQHVGEAITRQRSSNPASLFDKPGELEAWEFCVDVAFAYYYGGIDAIPIPFEGDKGTVLLSHSPCPHDYTDETIFVVIKSGWCRT